MTKRLVIHAEADLEMQDLGIDVLPWKRDRYGAICKLRFWSTEIRLMTCEPGYTCAKIYDGAGRNIGAIVYDKDGPCERWEHYFGCARAWYAGVREQQELKPNTKGKRTK